MKREYNEEFSNAGMMAKRSNLSSISLLFHNTTGNGVSDLVGITRRLDHIAQLGVNCVWLSPICKSPKACYTGWCSRFIALKINETTLGVKI